MSGKEKKGGECTTYLCKSQMLPLAGQPGTFDTLQLIEHMDQSGAGCDWGQLEQVLVELLGT